MTVNSAATRNIHLAVPTEGAMLRTNGTASWIHFLDNPPISYFFSRRGDAMRIAALKLVLSVIAISAVMVLGVGRAAADGSPNCPDPTFHLDNNGGNLVLNTTAPGVGTAKFLDSPVLSRGGGNPYQLIGEWDDGYVGSTPPACVLESLSPLHVWLGLRSSDDQGTNFDLRAEVYFEPNPPGGPTVLVASSEQLCIKGLARNPALAQEIVLSLPLIQHVAGDGEFIVNLYARIGTPQSKCGGHGSATGLRVYYDSADRDSRFDTQYEGGT